MDVKVHDATFGKKIGLGPEAAINGVSIVTSLLKRAETIIRDIKAANPGNIIITGGPQATAMPHALVKNPAIDYVVVGEGEVTFH